ncbi:MULTISPECIES: ApeP family dehydratase [Bowmanella]|uniref:Thioester dehydrase n=1 Tax=Bowmanella pacifica TaxID=502051 RepID=A0A918DH56_9ALTE|nr:MULTISPECIES: hotdog family protein [Bowmanella]MBT1064182.1 hotdog family protein [Bowmanella yangjiangensis]GGO65896.1 thioester dehydrase [Bowmanella pacifica]
MYQIEDLIPHRPPMVLIDAMVAYDEQHAKCRVCIHPQVNFFDSALNGVPAHVGMEYMAQTIAAFAGAQARDAGEPISVGFLLGSRKYECLHSHFANGTELLVSVEQLHREASGLGVFDCRIEAAGMVLAQAKINVFQPENASQYVREASGKTNE